VVGFGITGAAAALFLRRAGHIVSVFDAAAMHSESGAGLLLQPAALAVLHAAGLAEAIAQVAVPIRQIVAEFAPSRRRFVLDYDAILAPSAFGIQRGALLRILRGNAPQLSCHWQTAIKRVDAEKGLLWNADGVRFGPFDLIVGADGVNSALRAQCRQIVAQEHRYPTGAVVCVATLAQQFTESATLTQIFSGHSHVSHWSVGASEVGGAAQTALAMPVAVEQLDTLAMNPNLWFLRLQTLAPELADQLTRSELPKLLPYSYRDVIVNRYHHARLLLIGDAAHAMSPQLGLGASLGLCDAWFLAQCLRDYPLISVPAQFDQARRRGVVKLRRISQIATPLFQSEQPWIAAAREPIMRLFAHKKVMQHYALRTLTQIPQALAGV
jgi:2-polyprenyl-6-methoxyphenol hydroxylase-like FAD-dependent oxidoreductase